MDTHLLGAAQEPMDSDTDLTRTEQIRRIADDCLLRRAAGQEVSDESVAQTHQELMPELAEWLHAVRLLEVVQKHHGNSSRPPKLPFSDPSVQCGTTIGPYRVLSMLGEGGCGIVYLAASEAPVKRQVALKVIKPGMDSKQVVARFEAERQALAVMDHPGVAKVFDAGMTHNGRPYFAMECVNGVPIADHCDRNRCDVKQRLMLMIDVCAAVQHAHQKGVVHRDIKPSNLLVTSDGEKSMPKVIDFGLAKALHEPLTDRTVFTQHGQLIGTPAYMSPEQANPSTQDIDTRTDVYSLGVVLYELLIGVLPFERHLGSDEELRRAVYGQYASTPSSRLATLSDSQLRDLSRSRGVGPCELKREIRGDLDSIVLKCLETDRAHRYETADALAMDIQRHLDNEPVLARPPSTLYRLNKMARRNKAAFAATVAVFFALIAGVTLATLGFANAVEERSRAEVERSKAVEQRRKADDVSRELARENYLGHLATADTALLVGNYRQARISLDLCSKDLKGWEWFFLDDRLKSKFATVDGRVDPVFSAEGRWLIAIGGEKQNIVRIWDANELDADPREFSHERLLRNVAISPNGSSIVAGDIDGYLTMWDFTSGERRGPYPVHQGATDGLAFSPDGETIVTVSWDDKLLLIDEESGATLLSVSFSLRKPRHLRQVAFSPHEGRWIATSIHPDEAVLIDVHALKNCRHSTGKGMSTTIEKLLIEQHAHKLDGHMLPTFSPVCEDLMATGNLEGKITFWTWDGQNWVPGSSIEASDKPVWALTFSADGKRLASGHKVSGDIKVWNINDETELNSFQCQDYPRYLAFHPKKKQIASSSVAHGVQLWSYPKHDHVSVKPYGESLPIRPVEFSPDGSRILVGVDAPPFFPMGPNGFYNKQVEAADCPLVILDADSLKEVGRTRLPAEGGTWSSNQHVLTCVRVEESAAAQPRYELQQIAVDEKFDVQKQSESFPERSLPLRTRSNERFVAVGIDGYVRNWDMLSRNLESVRHWKPDTDQGKTISAAAVDPGGQYLALAFYWQYELELWDLHKGRMARSIRLPSHYVYQVVFTDDRIFLGSNGGTLEVYGITSGKQEKRFLGTCR